MDTGPLLTPSPGPQDVPHALVDDSGETTAMTSPKENLTTNNPQAPAAAPKPSLSDAEEAQPQPKRTRKNRRRTQQNATATPTLEDLFGPRSEAWTRFHAISVSEELDNIEIYEDLNHKLPDEFECFRRKDGTIVIDAKTKRNSDEIEKLQEILNKEVTTSRDPRLNSVRGTILLPLSEFKSAESAEERILKHLQIQNIPASKVSIYNRKTKSNKILVFASITFESRSIPSHIRIGFEKVKVREDLPKPRQCRACWRFGHPIQYCRSTPCCPICGDQSHILHTGQLPLQG